MRRAHCRRSTGYKRIEIDQQLAVRELLRLQVAARAVGRLSGQCIREGQEEAVPVGEQPFAGFNAELDESSFDDGFSLMEDQTTFSVTGAICKVKVELLAGYRYAQVFAPKDKDYIALEPMTAPTSALRQRSRASICLAG